MALSEQELQLLLKKLRDRYAEYSKKFNRVWFNLEAFDDRYKTALNSRMNLEGFILAEIANFEKIKEKYDKKKREKSFTSLVDEVMEEHSARIKKYPGIYFHPRADFEMIHFYGALSDFARHVLPALRLVVFESFHKNTLNGFEDRLTVLAVHQGKRHARRIQDHVLVLTRPPTASWQLEMERDKSAYMRESAFTIHEIIDFCDELLQARSPEWETPLRFDRLYVESENRKGIIDTFSSLTGYGAIIKVRDTAAAIIDDFRLSAFKKRK
jgi:hypothetical protein